MKMDSNSQDLLSFEHDDDDDDDDDVRVNQVLDTLRFSSFEPPSTQRRTPNSTRLILMSDTHANHGDLMVPKGDVLIHAGDFTKLGERGSVVSLSEFFGRLQAKGTVNSVVCIAGNHDICFHEEFYQRNWDRFQRTKLDPLEVQACLTNCIYLRDNSHILPRCNSEIYGSPWSPTFYEWAFNLDRGAPIRERWEQIPSSTDVLITHSPPLGRGDMTNGSGRVGCFDLLEQVQKRIKPRLHVFGHIHEDAGVSFDGATLFVNASNVDLKYNATNPCRVVDLPHDLSQSALIVEPTCELKGTEFGCWLNSHGYERLAALVTDVDASMVPDGNNLLEDSAYTELSDALLLHRDKESRHMLKRALAQLYAESFQ